MVYSHHQQSINIFKEIHQKPWIQDRLKLCDHKSRTILLKPVSKTLKYSSVAFSKQALGHKIYVFINALAKPACGVESLQVVF